MSDTVEQRLTELEREQAAIREGLRRMADAAGLPIPPEWNRPALTVAR